MIGEVNQLGIWVLEGSASVVFMFVKLAIFSVAARWWLWSVQEERLLLGELKTIWVVSVVR